MAKTTEEEMKGEREERSKEKEGSSREEGGTRKTPISITRTKTRRIILPDNSTIVEHICEHTPAAQHIHWKTRAQGPGKETRPGGPVLKPCRDARSCPQNFFEVCKSAA
jgi:hypothetical protein